MDLARTPRARTAVNLSVGLLMLLLIASLLLYRLTLLTTTVPAQRVGQPAELWRSSLISEPEGAAPGERHTFILTRDKLGGSALAIFNSQGQFVRTESLGSSGRFSIASSPLGVICVGIDQGCVSLYGAAGKRLWTAHLPGAVTAITADVTGITAAYGPPSGARAGDAVVSIACDGTVGRATVFPYGAVTALVRGPAGESAVAVFTADPSKAAEAIVFVQADGETQAIAGAGFGAARLAATAGRYYVGTSNALAAYDGSGQRMWTTRATGISAVAACEATVVTAEGDTLVGRAATDGKRLWRLRLDSAPAALATDRDGVVAATAGGLTACDWAGRPRWTVRTAGLAWDLGDGILIVAERETAIAYRTR